VSSRGGSPARLSAALRGSGTVLNDPSCFPYSLSWPSVKKCRTPVDVAALERKPFFGTKAGEADEEGERSPLGGELVSDRFQVLDGLEGRDLAPLRLRVRHGRGRVLRQKLDPDRVVEHGPQRLVNPPGRALR
jgi:hypothetical protein